MQRILEPGQIESFAQATLPRLRLPDRQRVFSTRAARLRQQSEAGAIGHTIGDYLRLIAHLADAQQTALRHIESTLPSAEQIASAREFRMPLIAATGWHRQEHWRQILMSLCHSVAALPGVAEPARAVCDRLRALESKEVEAQADALLAAQTEAMDVASAPFIMAALQVYWVDLASRLGANDVHELDVPGVCPICGTLPVASVVRADPKSQGFRYLHCALCSTEWHMVRVKCSNCYTTQGISYQSIENGPSGIRAECCDTCRTYRKILYQEQDGNIEPVADDLASLTLDLLLGDAGYRRASASPFLLSVSA